MKDIIAVFKAINSEIRSLVVDELSSSVICALLRAGEKVIEKSEGKSDASHAEFNAIVASLVQTLESSTEGFLNSDDDDNTSFTNNNNDDEQDQSGIAALAKHHIGRRIVSALIEAGDAAVRKQLNKILAARALFLIKHRHGSVCLIRLLQLYPKSAKTIAPAVLTDLSAYLADPVSERVAESTVTPKTAVAICEAVLEKGLDNFISSKRPLRFLTKVLNDGFASKTSGSSSTTAAEENSGLPDVAAAVEVLKKMVEELTPSIPAMCVDERGNLFVQSLVRAVGAVGDNDLSLALVKIALTPAEEGKSLSDLLMDSHAVHVIVALATSGGPVMSTEVSNVFRPHLKKLVLHQHGSLAVRRFVESSAASAEKILDMLEPALIPQMITNDYGNIVIQSIVKNVKQPKRIEFYKKYIAPKLVEYCQHPFAAHVVHMLLENSSLLDGTTHQSIFVALKPHVLELTQHLNGRYIVEQLVVPHREVKDILTTNFVALAGSKGSQQVLTKLYETADPATRARITKVVADNLADLATNQASSISVQKLLQSDLNRAAAGNSKELLAEVRKMLGLNVETGAEENKSSINNGLLQRLRGDFFGRFVVSIASGQQMSAATENNSSSSNNNNNNQKKRF